MEARENMMQWGAMGRSGCMHEYVIGDEAGTIL